MKIFALSVALAFVLLPVFAMAAQDGLTTDAAKPPDIITAPGHGIRALGNAHPDPAAMPEDLRMLLGSEAYPGAPTAADLGFTGPRCELDCGPCDLFESEPICEDEWVDIWTGGCNSSPEAFQPIDAAYGRITLCGTSGTYLVSAANHRDTDWFEIQLDDATDITFCCAAEFPLQIILIDGTAGCPSPTILDSGTVDACVEVCIQQTIGPGTFWLWVGPSVFDGIPCGEEYIMTVDGHLAVECDVTCPGEGIPEGEQLCHPEYLDDWNGGCNSWPYVFEPLEPGERTITVCGETGVYPYIGMCYRDTDWYEIILDQQREIEVCAFGDFPLQLFILNGTCDAIATVSQGTAEACAQVCLSDTLDPGAYWLWVGPSFWAPIDCGRRYTMTVSGYTTPVERDSWGSIKSLYR